MSNFIIKLYHKSPIFSYIQYFIIFSYIIFQQIFIIPFILNKIRKNVILNIIYFCYVFSSYLRSLKRSKYKIR